MLLEIFFCMYRMIDIILMTLGIFYPIGYPDIESAHIYFQYDLKYALFHANMKFINSLLSSAIVKKCMIIWLISSILQIFRQKSYIKTPVYKDWTVTLQLSNYYLNRSYSWYKLWILIELFSFLSVLKICKLKKNKQRILTYSNWHVEIVCITFLR